MAGMVLMENAGAGAARIVMRLAAARPAVLRQPLRIVCGPGNNGGDGFVVARHLREGGHEVSVLVLGGRDPDPGSDAGRNLSILERMGSVPILRRPTTPREGEGSLLASGTVIDAIFGTGLSRPVTSPYREWIEEINRGGSPVVSLDIPSGLDADTGEVLGVAVRAAVTITFAAPKLGFSRGSGPELCGTVEVVDIGLPRELWE